MNSGIRRARLAAGLFGAAVLIAACGGGSKTASTTTSATVTSTPTGTASATTTTSGHSVVSVFAGLPPSHIISDAAHAVAAARSFTVAGQLSAGTFSGQITLKLQGSSVGLSLVKGTERAQAVLTATGVDLKANQAFWMQSSQGVSAAVAAGLANRWFKVPAGEVAGFRSGFKQFTTTQLASCLSVDLPDPKVTSTSATVDGQGTVVVHTPGRGDDGPSDVYFATAAPHYPLRLVRLGSSTGTDSGGACPTSGSSKGALDFSDWNATTVSVPTATSPLP